MRLILPPLAFLLSLPLPCPAADCCAFRSLAAGFNQPHGVAVDAARGWVYVADFGGQRVARLGLDLNFLDQSPPGAVVNPAGMAVLADGRLVVADVGAGYLRVLDPGSPPNPAWVNGPSMGSGILNAAHAVAADAAGSEVYAGDELGLVHHFHDSGGAYALLSSTTASSGGIRGLHLRQGKLYLAEGPAGQIRRLDAASLAAEGAVLSLPSPRAVWGDAQGRLYVTVYPGAGYRVFGPGGDLLAACANAGAAPGAFDEANSLGTDAAGFVYVSDRLNNRVQKMEPCLAATPAPQPTADLPLLYPQPVRDGRARLAFRLNTAARIRVMVHDEAGTRVWARDLGACGAGSQDLALELDDLAPGVYFLALQAPGQVWRPRKFLVLR